MKETAYFFQATLVIAWWIGLAVQASFFELFQFPGIPPIAFWSLLLPDLSLIGLGSLARAYYRWRPLEWCILGAFAYATLFCVNASLLTGGGWLSTGLMLCGLAYNLLLSLEARAFRNSRTQSVAMNVSKTALQIICFWGLFFGVLPYWLHTAVGGELPVLLRPTTALGLFLFCIFGLLGLSSAWFMASEGRGTPLPLDQANRLVVCGPYRYVRNPMAIAGVCQCLALALVYQSWVLVVYAVLGAAAWQMAVRPIEENELLERFGEEYQEYRQRVSCWWPNSGRWVNPNVAAGQLESLHRKSGG